jgi:hypothetical protein
MGGPGLLVYDSCNSHLTVDVKDAIYASGIALAVIPRGMTLALQFLDLYFFAYFKRLYAEEVDKVLETKTEKISSAGKRIIMTHCVATAWKKATEKLPIERLFRELGYIWSRDGSALKTPVMPGYKFDPLLAADDFHVPLTKAERSELALMEKEDATLGCVPSSSSSLLPPKKTKQTTLPFGKK